MQDRREQATWFKALLGCSRSGRAIGVAASLAVLLIAIAAKNLPKVRGLSDSAPEERGAPAGRKPEASLDEAYRAVEVVFRRGDTLMSVLTRSGLDRVSAHGMAGSLRPFLNPRRIRVGERMRLLMDPEETSVRGVEYVRGATRVRATPSADGWSAVQEEIPFERQRRTIRGTVRGSFYESGIEAGLRPLQIMNLATIFEYDIDFFFDFRQGDSFSVLFEELAYVDGRRETGRVLAAEITAGGESFHAFHYDDGDGEGFYYNRNGQALQRAFLRAPLQYRRISSPYMARRKHPITGEMRSHRAIDYAAPTGTPVVAIGRGRVIFAGPRGGYGNLVEIRHSNGYLTRYAHFSRIAAGIRKGRRVAQGEVIGYVGMTGLATGPHLHFEILRGGKYLNFLTLRLPPSRKLSGQEMARFEEVRDRRLELLDKSQFARSPSL